jgi:hypothetical protein
LGRIIFRPLIEYIKIPQVINLPKMIDTDKLYEMALELYEDDYHELAITLFHDAMRRQPPTIRHLDFLETSERIAKTAFYRGLCERYPNSWQIQFAQANFIHGSTAIKSYSELLENYDLEEIDRRQIRYCRLRENCKQLNPDYEKFREDFFYFWNIDPQLVPSRSKMRQFILRTIILEVKSSRTITALKRLSEEDELDEQARVIIQNKITLLKQLDEFSIDK